MSNKENWKVSILEHLSQIEFHTQQVKRLLATVDDRGLLPSSESVSSVEEQATSNQQQESTKLNASKRQLASDQQEVTSWQTVLSQQPATTKPEAANQPSSRKQQLSKKPFQFRDATFRYEAKDDQRNRRLMAFYKGLVHLGWIPQKTPMKQFIDLFQAERLYHRIQWTGPKSALAYLFKQLERQGHITLPHARIWTTVRSHFVQPDGQPFAPDLKDQPLPGEKTQAVIRTLLDLLVPERELGGFSIHTFSDE